MPPRFKYTKEEIIEAAYNLISKDGIDALTARNLGKKLNSSSKVIFGSFSNMDELKLEVIKYGFNKFGEAVKVNLMDKSKLAYISSGMTYINLAKDNPNIFKLLFMRDTRNEVPHENKVRDIIASFIKEKSKVSLIDAYNIHDKYWFFMHGIASIVATKFIKLDDDYIESILKENYESLVKNVHERG